MGGEQLGPLQLATIEVELFKGGGGMYIIGTCQLS